MYVGSLIVLAEDNLELRRLLAQALERDGHRVIEAATGAQLVEAVRELLAAGEPLRLIITDVRMPNGNGLDAGRVLREAGIEVPLIFVTAYGDTRTRSSASELGGVLLDKPLALGTLRQTVERVLAAG